MPEYKNSVVYVIKCNDPNVLDKYVGSTCSFKSRKYQHKSDCCCKTGAKYHYRIYECIRQNGGWDNWSMLPLEKVPCDDKMELRIVEAKWYETLNATLNVNCPIRSQEYWDKYYEDYRANHRDYMNDYYKINGDKLRLKKKEVINCECGGHYTRSNKMIHMRSKKHIKKMALIKSV